MTQVTIDSPDMDLTDGIKDAVKKASDKVEKYMDGFSLDCVIRKEPKKEVHVLLKFKPLHGPDIQAEATHSDFYKGLAQAQKRLTRQVVDLKGKREDEKKHAEATKSMSQKAVDFSDPEEPSEAA